MATEWSVCENVGGTQAFQTRVAPVSRGRRPFVNSALHSYLSPWYIYPRVNNIPINSNYLKILNFPRPEFGKQIGMKIFQWLYDFVPMSRTGKHFSTLLRPDTSLRRGVTVRVLYLGQLKAPFRLYYVSQFDSYTQIQIKHFIENSFRTRFSADLISLLFFRDFLRSTGYLTSVNTTGYFARMNYSWAIRKRRG